jgi:hypothetical protein
MKTQVIITQGNAQIVLIPDNEFETDLIEKLVDNKIGYTTTTEVKTDYIFCNHKNHMIKINLSENTK